MSRTRASCQWWNVNSRHNAIDRCRAGVHARIAQGRLVEAQHVATEIDPLLDSPVWRAHQRRWLVVHDVEIAVP
jgi:hypothetical protein